MAEKFPEAMNRIYKNVFVDVRTKKKIRADPLKVLLGKVRGRGSRGSKKLRAVRKK